MKLSAQKAGHNYILCPSGKCSGINFGKIKFVMGQMYKLG